MVTWGVLVGLVLLPVVLSIFGPEMTTCASSTAGATKEKDTRMALFQRSGSEEPTQTSSESCESNHDVFTGKWMITVH